MVERLSLHRACAGPFSGFFVSRNSPLPIAESGKADEMRGSGLPISSPMSLISSPGSDVLYLTPTKSGTSTGEERQDQRCPS